MSRWYRAYVGTATDPKIGGLALRANTSRSVVIAAWHIILESAADANAGGETGIDEFAIAAALGEPLEVVERIMAAFALADMFKDGKVKAWARRQYESDTSSDRTKKWRERNKNVSPQIGDVTVTSQERSVTPPDTETDTYKDDEERRGRATISEGAFRIAKAAANMCGEDWDALSPSWAGAPLTAQNWLNNHWPEDVILLAIRDQITRKSNGPPKSISYFTNGIADAVARLKAGVPVGNAESRGSSNGKTAGNIIAAQDRLIERLAEFDERPGEVRGEKGAPPIRLLSNG